MKRLFILLLLVSISLASNAQLNFGWVKSISGSSVQIAGTKITSDASGNIYMTGTFDGTRTFGTYTLIAAGISDAYVAKFDSAGNCIWANRYGYTNSTTTGNNICIDNNNDIYVCGGFTSVLQVDTAFYFSLGQTDNFLIKLTSGGATIRAKISGGQSTDNARALTVDAQNNVYMAGDFGYRSFFDNDTIATAGLSSLTDAFIVEYDSTGNVLWAINAGGPDNDAAFAIHYSNNSLYLAGVFVGTAVFQPNNITATGAGTDVFIARYNLFGNNLWVQKAGGTANDFCYDMSTDPSGNAYLTGSIILNAGFGTLPPLNVGNFPDIFIAKIDSNGTFLYAKNAGSTTMPDNGAGIATDIYGYTVITGSFSGTALFSPFSITTTGATDIFIAKYSASGNCQYALKAGGVQNDGGSSATWLSSSNEFVISGNYQNSATFGTTTINTPVGANYASFLTKIPGYYSSISEQDLYDDKGIIFPNPAIGKLAVKLPGKTPAVISLINSTGQLVMQTQSETNQREITIDISSFIPGIYMVKINSGNLVSTYKLQVIR